MCVSIGRHFTFRSRFSAVMTKHLVSSGPLDPDTEVNEEPRRRARHTGQSSVIVLPSHSAFISSSLIFFYDQVTDLVVFTLCRLNAFPFVPWVESHWRRDRAVSLRSSSNGANINQPGMDCGSAVETGTRVR